MTRILPNAFSSSRIIRLLGLVVCSVLGGLVLNLVVAPAQSVFAATCTGATITGTAFRDYNATGAKDSGEPGLAGIVVTAYAADGAVATCETGADGTYGIDPAGAFPVRLEFTLPSNGQLNFLHPGVKGAESGTTVTFLKGSTTGVNIGFSNPGQYCGANPAPELVTSCFVFGEQNDNPNGVNKDRPVLSSFPYTAGSTDLTSIAGVDFPPPGHPALARQMGSVWGLAWNPQNQTLYTAAFMKRHSGFGPNGPGAIYQLSKTGASSLFYNFGDLAGTDPHPKPGTLCPSLGHNLDTTNANCWLNDSQSFDKVGKVGFGDLDISDDFKTLYTVNLATNALMAIPVANPAVAGSIPLPTPLSCPAADVRPFGLGVNDGVVYVGMVCSAESSRDINQLRAYIYAYANGAFAATPALDFPLTYDRGSSNLQWAYWLNTTSFNLIKTDARVTTGKWAQPWLTDITFDHGNMILALRDRNADLFGTVAGGPDPLDSVNYTAISRGDILRACAGGNGGWTLEANGTCGNVTTSGAGNGQGPGGGEYYFRDEQAIPPYTPTTIPIHGETSIGAQLQVPGLPDVVSMIFNPIDVAGEVSDGGAKWYNNATGITTRSYRVLDASGGGTPPPLFGKANGLGDLAALCPLAPLEIGNRVWLDSNGNGIQDAAESGIDGILVELYRNGALVGSTTTANGGEYYFNNSNIDDPAGIAIGTGTAGGNSDYEIRIPNISGVTPQAPLAGLSLTGVHQDNNANGNLRDSDGVLNGANATYLIPYADLAGPGNNNHTYDFGFSTAASPPVADLEIVKTVTPGAYVQGVNTNVTFVFTVTNHGPSDVTNATVTDNQPANVTFNSWTCVIGAAGSGAVTNACGAPGGSGNIATTVTLRNGATAIFTINATVGSAATGAVINTASETLPSGVTQNPNQNLADSSSASLTPQGVVDLEILKIVTPGVYTQGANTNVTFVFTVTDHGPSDVTNAPVTDNQPANVTFTSWTCAIGAAGSGAVTNACGAPGGSGNIATTVTLRNGATAIFTINATVGSAATGVIVNTASESLPTGVTQNPNQNLPDSSSASLASTVVAPELASLGDFVWQDSNSNGLQDAGESPVASVAVTLLSGAGTQLAQTTTNANGFYQFTNLQPGDYQVCFTLPTGDTFTTVNQGSDDTKDSDADPTTGCTSVITLTSGEDDTSWDAGLIVQTAALGGCTWNDGREDVADGIRDPNETLLTGVVAILLDANGQEIKRTTTDTTGCYIFENLAAGNYMVSFIKPTGFIAFTLHQSASNGSDADPVTGQTVLINLPAGVRDLTWDAGFVSTPTALEPGQEPLPFTRLFLPWLVR